MPASSRSTPASSIKKKPRDGKAYRLTCANCRSRKVKCDGDQPQCRICLAYGETCHYDKPPPMSQVLAMAHKIEELEKALAVVRGNIHQPADPPSISNPTAAISDQQHIPPSEQQRVASMVVQDPSDSIPLRSDYESPVYQSTSALVEPTTSLKPEAGTPSQSTNLATDIPFMGEAQLQYWTDAMLHAAATQLNLPVDKIRHLFQTHWTWVHPCYLFVSRPVFLRDAAIGGEHFSLLLLCVLCLHSTRFTEHGLARELQAKVQLLLGQELHKEPSVPTVQALLQLSAKSIGAGEVSQAWLYSGMAFRMAVQLGVFARPLNCTDALAQGVREQLAWSCYLWDKAISLYLGRTPSLSDAPTFDPPWLDEVSEHALWIPYFGSEAVSGSQGPAQTSHTMSCFRCLCKLSTIVNDILLTVYSQNSTVEPLTFVKDARKRLEDWHASAPSHLITLPEATSCPPPHVIHVNLCYHVATILLHRPFRASKHCRAICRSAADAVAHLILLLEQTLGLSHVTYMMAYCAYTAATVAVLDMADGVEGSEQRVNTYLRALYGARYSCPGIQRSIDIIVNGFNNKKAGGVVGIQDTVGEPHPPAPFDLNEADMLPAFVSDQHGWPSSHAWTGEDGADMSAIPFGLDPFAMAWSRIPIESFDEYLTIPTQESFEGL